MPRMEVPASGVKVRMYRQGHGDCFLLAFRDDDDEPFYLLIDCGYKPGSQVHHKIKDIVDDIGESTGDHIHAVLITHEHQDHVNGFWSKVGGNEIKRFESIDVDRLWLAWTEDPTDDVANHLRTLYSDTLIGLMAAQEQLAAAADPQIQEAAERVDKLLAFEIEDESENGAPSASAVDRDEFLRLAIKGITNKRAIKYIKDKTGRTPLYLRPGHSRPYWFPNISGVSVYALGPPRNEKLLLSSDPVGGEGYAKYFGLTRDTESFLTAAVENSPNPTLAELASNVEDSQQPFAPRYRIPEDRVNDGSCADFFGDRYGVNGQDHKESWRRIDQEWLRTAETLALRLNSQINNTCLVTAIELPKTGKVLLFVGDAQRGNWVSWDDQQWIVGNREVTAKDLLSRTVLYKVGHHGSHNATLKGYSGSDYPNLNWMARGNLRNDFVAMIPANRDWAYSEANWSHPLRSIEQALLRKAKGRVFRIDVDHVTKPSNIDPSEWQSFNDRTKETDLYFEYLIPD